MFGNLKSKLGDVTDLKKYASPQVLSSLTGSRQRSSQHTPGSQTPTLSRHSRQPSDSSLQGAASSTSLSYSTLLEKNEFSQPSKDIEQLERELEKLKSALETQQDSALQRLNNKELEWKHKLEQEYKKVSSLEEELKISRHNEETLYNKLLANENKNLTSTKNILLTEDAEAKLVALQENYDQLEGFGTQEVAKVKHLLLSSTNELEKNKSDLEEKSSEVKALKKQLSTLQGLEERVHVLSEEKMDLETKVAGLTQRLNAANTKLMSATEEYEEEVKHLKERISILDQRNSQGSMQEEEKTQAIVLERESYEHKMEEMRQQLNNIKSSWSEKITALESQIQNLNEKIAEDQMDLKAAEELNKSLQEQTETLKAEKQTADETHEREAKSYQERLDLLQEDLESAKWQCDSESTKKNAEIKELRRSLHMQEEKGNQLREELNSKNEEVVSLAKRCSELDSRLKDLESKNSALEERCSALQTSNNTLQEHLCRERACTESLEQELRNLKEKYDVVHSEKTKLSSNLDKYLEKVNTYESTIESMVLDNHSLDKMVKEKEIALEEYKERVEDLTTSVEEMEADFEAKVENSELVRALKEKLKIFEDEILEKKQMLKVQSQRLADLKKTIQRELKINPDTTEGFVDTGNNTNPMSPRLSCSNQRSLSDQSYVLKVNYRSNEVQNGEPEFDPVNLEYLKHVILKFVTSREYEAVQLTRAVSTLLHMNAEEETLLRETLEWKMSWFAPKPNIGKGQLAKAIPPSQ